MLIYVDIDGTICITKDGKYKQSVPIYSNIAKINKLYDEGNTIVYWTARGAVSGIDWTDLTRKQLKRWGARHHDLRMNSKPHYDLLICDKTKRIEEV
tara:strand:- start:453 stop:743 length:291 start_codon:yes stop_codon:yes gene_type:complete